MYICLRNVLLHCHCTYVIATARRMRNLYLSRLKYIFLLNKEHLIIKIYYRKKPFFSKSNDNNFIKVSNEFVIGFHINFNYKDTCNMSVNIIKREQP